MLTTYGSITAPSLAIAGADHRDLQRAGRDVELADRAQRELRRVQVVGELAGHPVQIGQVPGVEAELLRLDPQLVLAELQPEVGERGVAGDAERLGDGDPAPPQLPWIRQEDRGARQLEPVRGGDLGVGVMPSSSAAAAVTSLKTEPGG